MERGTPGARWNSLLTSRTKAQDREAIAGLNRGLWTEERHGMMIRNTSIGGTRWGLPRWPLL